MGVGGGERRALYGQKMKKNEMKRGLQEKESDKILFFLQFTISATKFCMKGVGGAFNDLSYKFLN